MRSGVSIAVAALCILLPRAASAIPVFARIYGKPCGACHTLYPQLNPAGEDFRAHGLHGLEPAIAPLRLGSHLDVPGTLPLALSLAAGEDVTRTDAPGQPEQSHSRTNFNFLALLAGGELGSHLAFLADLAPLFTNPVTGDVMTNNRLGLGFLQAHAEADSWLLNARAGLFELPFAVSPRVHRLSVQGYLIYGLTAFDLLRRPSPARGERTDSLQLGSTQVGLEASGRNTENGLAWALGVTNGSNNRKDNNASKDVYLRVGESFGFHKTGLFLYYSPDVLGQGVQDAALRLGPDLDLYFRRGRILAQFLANHDSNPTARGEGFWFYGGFVEGNYRLTSRLLALVRTDQAWAPEFDDRNRGGTTDVRPWTWSATAGVQFLIEENLKLVVEGTQGERREGVSDHTMQFSSVTVRIATAFWPFTPPLLTPLLTRGQEP
jgi:hypothetical protein